MAFRLRQAFRCSAVRSLVCVVTSAFAASASSDDAVLFNRDVRSILSSTCYECHGPDESHREADLRLDTQDGIAHAFLGGLAESEAWARLSSGDADLVMPPADSHKELKPAQIETLRKWIEQGAEWQGHWSFITPTNPDVPVPTEAAWGRHPIDAFILERLQSAGLSPSPEADKERLLRRVTLDLTGLPPTIEEMDAFLADDSPTAYEQVVDRLVQSPHFGERMAVMWMDAARYGDTSVFHADGPRDMWPWRDWVIDAYNSNKPFDEFTVEQLAGDLIPTATTEQKVATGFLRNNASTDEGGAIPEEYRVEYAVDRVKTVSMIWLGLSLECAQCHNHKYDPITQEEYYRVFAYFNQASDPGMQTRNGNESPIVDLFDDEKLAQADALKPQEAELKQRREVRAVEAEDAFKDWVVTAAEDARSKPLIAEDTIFHAALDEQEGKKVVAQVSEGDHEGEVRGQALWAEGRHGRAFQCNGSNYINFGDVADFERTDAFSYGCWLKPEDVDAGVPLARMEQANAYRGFDLGVEEGLVRVHLVNKWPENALKVRTKQPLKKDEWQHVFVTYDGSSTAAGVKVYVNGELQEMEIKDDKLSDTIRTEVPLYVGRRNADSPFKGLVDEVRIYNRLLGESEVAALAGDKTMQALLVKAAGERTAAENDSLRQHYLTTVDDPFRELSEELANVQAKIAELSKPRVNVMVMGDVAEMRPTYVLNRGNYASPLEDRKVTPGVPLALPPLPEGVDGNRLGLAKWLVDPSHPLTARVTVNRSWAMLFGEGFVKTVEDFGSQGEWPTHPELLDWLAIDFVESGWDVKRMLKQMVMSSTYRQTSRVTAERLAADPENRLLSHGPRFRLQGEFIRDNALAASGLLVPRTGGPGVKPYQPPGLWNEVSLDGDVRFEQDHGENLYRRSMYTYWKRSSPAPAMTTFDSPTREKCVLKRSRTNTPLQALVTLNDVQFMEAARVLAERAIHEGGDTLDARIVYAFRLATGVRPTASIVSVLQEAFEQELPLFTQNPESATAVISAGESPRDETLDPAVHAAMSIVSSLILNLDETLTRG